MIFQEPGRREMNCCQNLFCRLGVVPFLFSTCSIITILITYSISVANKDVYPYFPTISDTGGIPPESNIFGFCLSVCAFIGFVSVVIRFYQYRFISENNEEHRARLVCMNKISVCLGVVSTSGALVVAAFQDRGISGFMHMIGALLVFGFGVLYCFTQSYLTYQMVLCGMNTKRLFIIRIILSFFSLTFFIAVQVFQRYAANARAANPPKDDIPHWRPRDAGFTYNVLADASEWSMALSFFTYFLTFVGEFNKVKMNFSFQSGGYNLLVPFQVSEESDKDCNYVPSLDREIFS